MGVPIRHLVVASNENNILQEFLNTGVYDVSVIAILFRLAGASHTLNVKSMVQASKFVSSF